MDCVWVKEAGVRCGRTVSRYLEKVEERVGTGRLGRDDWKRSMGGAVGSIAYPGGGVSGAEVEEERAIKAEVTGERC